MKTALKWKLGLLAFLVLFSTMTVLPSFDQNEEKILPDWWHTYLAPDGLRLGLDLQGGMHLVLKVDLPKAIENTLDLAAQALEDELADQQITVVRTDSGDPQSIHFTLPNTGAVDTIKKVVEGDFPNLDIVVKADEGTFPRIYISLKKEAIKYINDNAVNQSLEVIRNRIDQFGVAEPVIVRQGEDEILIQLPGEKNPDRAIKIIKDVAHLEFKLVANTPGVNLDALIQQAIDEGKWSYGKDRKNYSAENRKKLNLVLKGKLPDNTEIFFQKEINSTSKAVSITPILLDNVVLLTGDMVQDAQTRFGGTFNEPYVSLDFTGRGGKIFAKVTEKSVNRRLAIVLDEIVKSAPVIREKILGGSAQISGNFTFEEATDLAIVLRVGALPAPVSIVQNLTVGASLGHDSIEKGLFSGIFGALLVLIFMAFVYRLSGVIANIALFFNTLLLFCGLAMMNATLTLPGIAGIILAIGMAVDSNVLIFERMREEFALGKSVKSGIEGGYDKALWTIIDSQVTTLITALALFLFGTGPIKGFAVTLSLGVTFNLFTTLFGTRLAYDYLHAKKMLKPLKFVQIIKKPSIDYMGMKKIAFSISTVMVLLGLFAFGQIVMGKGNLGVDFSGGILLQYKAAEPFSLEDARAVLDKSDIEGLQLQQANNNRLIVKLKISEKTVGSITDTVTNLLNQEMPSQKFDLESRSEIGSSVSKVLRNKALQAIAISLFGVLCYLAMRFDFRFGMAAAAATIHDVLAVLGICYLLNIEISLLIVTALLTLAGYSLNDSVVVFDRIREHLRKNSHLGLSSIINTSINEVLSRTVVTSLTTFLVLASIFFLGGSMIHDFSLALLLGVLVGTYSSIFIASPLLHVWRKKEEAA